MTRASRGCLGGGGFAKLLVLTGSPALVPDPFLLLVLCPFVKLYPWLTVPPFQAFHPTPLPSYSWPALALFHRCPIFLSQLSIWLRPFIPTTAYTLWLLTHSRCLENSTSFTADSAKTFLASVSGVCLFMLLPVFLSCCVSDPGPVFFPDNSVVCLPLYPTPLFFFDCFRTSYPWFLTSRQ